MYIQLNSQVICYEKTGEGSPVILIHGNCGDHHTFDALARVMEKEHTVVSMDLRGHGESAIPNEFHYSDMAEDVINLIKALELEKPYIVGYSDGGIVALLVAAKRSSLIGGIVCCGANCTPNGIKHGELHKMKVDYKKTQNPRIMMMLKEPNIDDFMLGCIKTKALILAGENDCIKEKETKFIASHIAGSKMIIIPKEDHSSYIEGTDKLYFYIRDFLE